MSRRTRVTVSSLLLALTAVACNAQATPQGSGDEKPFEVSGSTVKGTTTVAGAPVLKAGRYVDAAPGPDTATHYIIRRSLDASTVFVGVSALPRTASRDDRLTLQLWTVSGTQCGTASSRDYDAGRQNSLVTVAVDTNPSKARGGSAKDREACRNATELHLVVEPDYGSDVGTGTSPLAGADDEIVVIEEPSITTLEGLPAPTKSMAGWGSPIPVDDRRAVRPGTSFPKAAPLSPGSYRASIRPGTYQLFRTRVGWGQRMRAEVQVSTPGAELADQIDADQQIDVRLIAPTRAEASVDYTALPGDAAAPLSRTKPTKLKQMTYDVRYRNRDSPRNAIASGASLAGDYYVVVTLAPDAQDEAYNVPYTLDISVDDTSDGSAPEYAGEAQIAGPVTEATPPAGDPPTSPRDLAIMLLLVAGLALVGVGGLSLLVVRRYTTAS